MQTKGRVVLTGEVSDTPVIRVTFEGCIPHPFRSRAQRGVQTAPASTQSARSATTSSRVETSRSTIRNKVRKGNRLSVEGEFNLKQWEEKSSGETKYLTRVLIDRFTSAEPDQLALPMAA